MFPCALQFPPTPADVSIQATADRAAIGFDVIFSVTGPRAADIGTDPDLTLSLYTQYDGGTRFDFERDPEEVGSAQVFTNGLDFVFALDRDDGAAYVYVKNEGAGDDLIVAFNALPPSRRVSVPLPVRPTAIRKQLNAELN